MLVTNDHKWPKGTSIWTNEHEWRMNEEIHFISLVIMLRSSLTFLGKTEHLQCLTFLPPVFRSNGVEKRLRRGNSRKGAVLFWLAWVKHETNTERQSVKICGLFRLLVIISFSPPLADSQLQSRKIQHNRMLDSILSDKICPCAICLVTSLEKIYSSFTFPLAPSHKILSESQAEVYFDQCFTTNTLFLNTPHTHILYATLHCCSFETTEMI